MTVTRRQIASGIAAAALASTAGSDADAHDSTRRSRQARPVVLVHGAWHGGWCWREVARRLRASGLEVYTPTLTGLGERAHLRTPVPTLTTHIADVASVIETEELRDVVLVGHSYAGMVVTGACDRLRDAIAHVVYLDAAIPENGQSMVTQMPGITPAQAEASRRQLVEVARGGEWLPPFPAAMLGIPDSRPTLRQWVDRRLTPHPLPAWLEPLRLANGGADGMPRTYVACTSPPLAGTAMPLHAARVRSGELGPTWRYREIATGHDAMVSAPAEVAKLVDEVAWS